MLRATVIIGHAAFQINLQDYKMVLVMFIIFYYHNEYLLLINYIGKFYSVLISRNITGRINIIVKYVVQSTSPGFTVYYMQRNGIFFNSSL